MPRKLIGVSLAGAKFLCRKCVEAKPQSEQDALLSEDENPIPIYDHDEWFHSSQCSECERWIEGYAAKLEREP